MLYLGIDPGDQQTGVVLYHPACHQLERHAIVPNGDLPCWLQEVLQGPAAGYRVGIESIASYGMAVGKTVFETAEWSGVIALTVRQILGCNENIRRVYRREVKLCLCDSPRAKDANIRQALIDLFPATGGGRVPQVGTKGLPGPLYGMAKDKWAALGVAITASKQWMALDPFPLPNK